MCHHTIIWNLKNPYNFSEKKLFFSCLGTKWTLEYMYYTGIQGEVVKLFLRRIACSDVSNVKFAVETSLLSDSGVTCLTDSIETNYAEFKNFCIWKNIKSKIDKLFCHPPTELKFSCLLRPDAGWEKPFLVNEQQDMKSVEHSFSIRNLCHDVGNLFNSNVQADVILNCCHKTIYAHRAILSVQSKTFATILQNDMKDSKEQSIDITDIEPNILERLIHYIYSGEMPNMTLSTAMKVYAAAHRYGMDTLKVECMQFITNKSATKESSSEEGIFPYSYVMVVSTEE